MSNIFNEEVGLLVRGAIVSYNSQNGTIRVKLNSTTGANSDATVEVATPHGLFYNNGLFIGTTPTIGSSVVLGQGSGGQYHFVSFLAEKQTKVPKTLLGELLFQANDKTFLTLDQNNEIWVGSTNNRLHINTEFNYISTNFYNRFDFTQASRKVDGIIKRDRHPNKNIDPNSKLENDNNTDNFIAIGMDPSVSVNPITTSSTKNPPFTENRELIYEFQYSSDIHDDLNESLLYQDAGTNSQNFSFPNRRKSRADTLSLTLLEPNFLMETIKGTVVDIFGNILDLNRVPLPVGTDQNTIQADKTTDKSASFLSIKEIERKSLAYHFEINARKDLTGQNGQTVLPDINSNADYARNRSRFFIDIDKEGQFKINVPASSETGNIPLLTRYENYSSFGAEDNKNPNKLIFRDDNLDIFQDSFAAPVATTTTSGFSYATNKGSVELKDGNADASPLDRITNAHIKHGMAYHDILQTCYVHQNNQFIDYQAGTTDPLTVDISKIPVLENVVSKVIKISGDEANAGGRSGSMNFDGSLEMNIGANTIDRQSLWLDLAGSAIMHLGRDKNKRSALINMDGDVFIQVGGFGVVGDSRFIKENNGSVGAVLDLRVMTDGGYTHFLRFDKDGIKIMTPGSLAIHSKGDMKISSDANINIEAERVSVQGRSILKVFGGSI